MKKISAIRNIPYLTIILLTLICILLLSSKNMIMSQASYPEATIVSSAYAVVEGSDSDKEEITFPHTFKHLSPRTGTVQRTATGQCTGTVQRTATGTVQWTATGQRTVAGV